MCQNTIRPVQDVSHAYQVKSHPKATVYLFKFHASLIPAGPIWPHLYTVCLCVGLTAVKQTDIKE